MTNENERVSPLERAKARLQNTMAVKASLHFLLAILWIAGVAASILFPNAGLGFYLSEEMVREYIGPGMGLVMTLLHLGFSILCTWSLYIICDEKMRGFRKVVYAISDLSVILSMLISVFLANFAHFLESDVPGVGNVAVPVILVVVDMVVIALLHKWYKVLENRDPAE